MAKKRIIVGYEYKDAFKSVCELIKGGCLDGLNYKLLGDVISDGMYEYELSAESVIKTENDKFIFTNDGATWFKALRGEQVDNEEAIWTTFIENVGIDYHGRYSVVEYSKQSKTQEEKDALFLKCLKTANQFVKTFYPQFAGLIDVKTANEEIAEDIYGVSMRIELSGGTGASLPILAKIYFSKDGKNMTAIKGSIAKVIDHNITTVIPDALEDLKMELPTESVDVTLNAIDSLINSDDTNFAEYLCYSDDNDEKAVYGLLDKLSHDAMEIECQRVDVLYVSHIKALAYACDVYHGATALFRVSVSIDGSVSFTCLNCNEGKNFVYKNTIEYVDGNGIDRTVILNSEAENLGLTNEEIESVKLYSTVNDHFGKVSCPNNPRHYGCEEYKCKSQLLEVKLLKTIVYKCKDCPYPEIIYTDANGEKQYTPNMLFAKDKMTLVDADEASFCAVCGRTFSKSAIKYGKCKSCTQLLSDDTTETNKITYKKYKSLLSLGVRFANAFTSKGCVEDDEVVLFRLGDKVYLFNKLNVKEKGLIKGPKKVYVRR